jgi:hypothetical protein
MATSEHDHSVHQQSPRDGGVGQPARPSWLLPALGTGAVGIGLVLAGLISATTLIYLGVIGGMLFMHLGHTGHGSHASATAPAAVNPNTSPPDSGRRPSSHSCR